MGFQSKPTPQSRIAIGSMIEDVQNEVHMDIYYLGLHPPIRQRPRIIHQEGQIQSPICANQGSLDTRCRRQAPRLVGH